MEALKEGAHAAHAAHVAHAAHAAALETALSTDDVEELRSSTEAAWHSEQDAERLQAKAVRVCEEAMARAQRMHAAAGASHARPRRSCVRWG